jgi:outer membrane protein assembly factor BamB
MVDFLVKKNNGLMANDWLMGDVKTGEIASLELATRNYALTRKNDGFIYSCNNPKDEKVRRELNSIFGFGLTGRIIFRNFIESPRDIIFQKFEEQYYGEFDVDLAKKIMTTKPIFNDVKTTDTKITNTNLVNNFGIWACMGYPDGNDFISDEYPLDESFPNYTNLPASGWIQIFGLLSTNKHPSFDSRSFSSKEKSNLIWSIETRDSEFGNIIYSSPIVKDDILYVTSGNGFLSSIDAKNGNEIWNENIGWSSTSTPVFYNNYIFVGSSNGLYAIEKDTGEKVWSKDIGTISCKPYYFDGVVFCGSQNGNVYALDSKSGEIIWIYYTDGAIYSSPIVYDNLLFVGSNDHNLYALDIDNRQVKWKYKTSGAVISSPIIHNDLVYFGSWDNNIYALDSETGELIWKYTTGWGVDSSPVIKNNVLFVGSEDNHLYALDAENGELKWGFKTNAGISSSPIVYGGNVFFGSQDGRIYSLDAKTGELIWSDAPDYHIQGILNYITKPIVSSPFAYDGKIYVGSTNGKIYSYDAKTYEKPEQKIHIDIPLDTWLLLVVPLILIILATAIYLLLDRRKIS